MQKVLNSRRTTIVLLVLLSGILMLGYSLAQLTAFAQSTTDQRTSVEQTTFSTIYFVPTDRGRIEEPLRPDSLLKEEQLEQYDLSIYVTSEWQEVQRRLSNEAIKAIVIHHNAADAVDWAILRSAFRSQNIVIAGIGIPGLELANMLGDSSLFSTAWSADGYTTSYYFYAYSYSISGNEADMKRLRENGWQLGEDPSSEIVIEEPLTVNYHASTDSLIGKQGHDVLFSSLYSHLLSLGDWRPFQTRGKVPATDNLGVECLRDCRGGVATNFRRGVNHCT